MAKYKWNERAFALPTVLISSVVMFILILVSISSATSVTAGLRNAYFDRLAKEAAESGIAYAKDCYDKVASIATASQWPNSSSVALTQKTDCFGAGSSGPAFVHSGTAAGSMAGYRLSFSVPKPTVAVDGTYTLEVTGTVELVRTSSTSLVSQTYTTSQRASIESQPLTWKQISVGGNYGCAIASDNKAYCWGTNTYKQLGDGTTTARSTPTVVSRGAMPSGATIRQISVSESSWSTAQLACAIASDNKAYCWGQGKLGNGSSTNSYTPVAVNLPSGVVGFREIAVGNQHVCAIASDNKAYCWGDNDYNQLGDGTANASTTPVPVSIPGGMTVRQIAAGARHTCAIASDNKAYCWGYNTTYGQLGDGTTVNRATPVLVSIPGGMTVRQITARGSNGCAIASDNKAYCWGYNYYGQVGDGTNTTPRITPVAVAQGAMPSGATIRQIFLGNNNACAIASDNKAYCWGYNNYGQLGDNTATNRVAPVEISQGAIPPNTTIRQISVGTSHACAIASDNKPYCWGYNYYGQLGNGLSGSANNSSVPVAVKDVADTSKYPTADRQIVAGTSHTCAIASDNKPYCWGDNSMGQLGDGTETNRTTPVAVSQGSMPLETTVRQISGGGLHTCALASDNKVYCWGWNSSAQLGNGTTTQRKTPVSVSQGAMPSGAMVRSIVTNTVNTCAIASDNKAYCWGWGSPIGSSSTPASISQGAMPSGAMVRQIAIDYTHACAIASDNKAYCWGENSSGQLGDGTTATRSTPVVVSRGDMPVGATIRSIAIGAARTCAIASDNKAYCWGENSSGQLGDGTTARRNAPAAVSQGDMPSGATIRQISVGNLHTCAIASDNKVYCWGDNSMGQLGDGTTTQRNAPVAVSPLPATSRATRITF